MYFPTSIQRNDSSLSLSQERELQHYLLTNKEKGVVKTFSQSKFKQLLMHSLLETNLDHKDFRILKSKKPLPPTPPKQKFPLSKLSVFDLPEISPELYHQPFTIGEKGEIAAVLEKSKVYLAPSWREAFTPIDFSSFPPITSIHATNGVLFTGAISGNLLAFDTETLKQKHKARSIHAIGPMTHLNRHTEIISNWGGSILLFDIRTKRANKLYSSSSFNGYQTLSHHASYLSFCDINQFIILDIRSPKSPLQQKEGSYDRVAFNNAGQLGIGSKDQFTLISPADLSQNSFTYPGKLCGLSPLEATSFATSRFDPRTNSCTIDLLTLSKNEIVIDRVLDTRENADPLDVDHIISYDKKVFCAVTREEHLKVWDFSVRKPEKKNVSPDPYESELTIR